MACNFLTQGQACSEYMCALKVYVCRITHANMLLDAGGEVVVNRTSGRNKSTESTKHWTCQGMRLQLRAGIRLPKPRRPWKAATT